VYTFGWGDSGRLGHGDHENQARARVRVRVRDTATMKIRLHHTGLIEGIS